VANQNDKWVERWAVRSSSGHGDYIIGRAADGSSCMGWCTHVYCPKCTSAIKKLEDKCSWCGTVTVSSRETIGPIPEIMAV
jgi:hypothetical protein